MDVLDRLDDQILREIIKHFDPASLTAFSRTCKRHRYHALQHLPRGSPQSAPGVTGQSPLQQSVSFSTASSSTPGSHAENDHAQSDTEMSTPEEDEWEFVVTDEMVRRLSLIPSRNHDAGLENLPVELQFMIFKHLDKIDSVCLGLVHPNLYVVHRAIHGTKIPLNTRRIGPNSLESAWEIVGRQECRQCGVYRCELHAHIKTWMPPTLEYCAMKQNFGLPAWSGASPTCFRGKPSKPKRCGRHPTRTTSIHQDDAQFSIAMNSSV